MRRIVSAFSTTEIIVALGIFILIALAVFNWQSDIYFLNNLLNQILLRQEQIRETIKNFVFEVRTAQFSNPGYYPIAEASRNSFTFYSDLDADGLKEKIRYFLENKTLKKGVIKPTGQPLTYDPSSESVTEIVHYLINPNEEIFTYYDKNYDGTGSPLSEPVNILEIRLIKITLTIDENINRPPPPITETSQVVIRNLKDNF